MSEQNKPKPPPEDEYEAGYVDLLNPAVLHKTLVDAFASYEWPERARPTTSKSWVRRKGSRRLEPRSKNQHDVKTSKFCIERVERILGFLATLMYFDQACEAAGVSSELCYRWVKRGNLEGKGPYWVFAQAVAQLGAAIEGRLLNKVHTFIHAKRVMPSKDAAEVAIKMLQLRFPKRWRPGVDVTTNGKEIGDGGDRKLRTIEVRLVDATTATQDPGNVERKDTYNPEDAVEKTLFDE
jgi:hypothetical protein